MAEQPKVFAFLYSIREMIANWKIPCSDRLFRYWLDKANTKINNPISQRRIVLFIVCVALFLDNMLYMVIVPIIPTYLRKNHVFQTETMEELNGTTVISLTTLSQSTLEASMSNTITTATSITATTAMTPQSSIIKSITMYAKRYEPSKNEDVNIGVLFACKAIFQLMINPFTGTLMDRIGYDIPMMIGLTIIFFSTSMFAVGKSYGALFVARSMQGIGSAFADTSGLAMIADRFQEDNERTRALGIALACISFGSLVAPPFGGSLYEFAGKSLPFILLSLVALGDGCLMLFAMKPVRKERRELKKGHKLPKGTPIYKLILDPYIAVCAGCLVMANVSLAFIEPTIALWMQDTMKAHDWQIGLIWLPAFIPHVLGVFVTVKLAERYPNKQWLMAAIGLVMEGVSCMIIPFCKTFELLMVPLCVLCFGIALVDTAVLPLMAHLVDIRHVSVYGSVYAIADISYSLAYSFGPIVAGQIVKTIGFTWLNAGIFLSNVLFAPLLIFLRHSYDYIPFKNEEDGLQNGNTPNHMLYQTYAASEESGQFKLDLTEQAITCASNGVVIHATSSAEAEMEHAEKTEALQENDFEEGNDSSSEQDNSDEEEEDEEESGEEEMETSLTANILEIECEKPLCNRPVPKPRRPSFDQQAEAQTDEGSEMLNLSKSAADSNSEYY